MSLWIVAHVSVEKENVEVDQLTTPTHLIDFQVSLVHVINLSSSGSTDGAQNVRFTDFVGVFA